MKVLARSRRPAEQIRFLNGRFFCFVGCKIFRHSARDAAGRRPRRADARRRQRAGKHGKLARPVAYHGFRARAANKDRGVISFAYATAIALIGLVLSSASADAAGPYRPFQTGLWSGGAYTDDLTGAFSHCSAGVVDDSGLNMFIVSTAGHGWWLGFTNPNWSLTPYAGLPIKLRFDARPEIDEVAAVPNGQLLLVPMPDDSRLLDTFRHSSQLSAITSEQSFTLKLGSTSAAISELTNCVHTSIAPDNSAPVSSPAPPAASESAVASAPAAPPAASPSASEMPAVPATSAAVASMSTLVARDWTEPEEVRLTRSFLMAAHLSNAHLVDTNKPAALASFKAVWRSDDAAGAVKIIPPGHNMNGVAIASELISVDPNLCKGDFAAARSRDVVDRAEVVRAVLSCADGHSELVAQYFIAPRQQGGFVVFAVIGDAGARNGIAADGDKRDLFDRAVVQAVASEE
jgi:hypothetical protein